MTTPSVHWTAAAFYRAEAGSLLCTLCPHACALREGQVGLCQTRRRRGGRLETAGFTVAVQHLDAVERKPFYHYRPGRKVLTLGVPGCTLRCGYCQNHRLSQFRTAPEAAWQGSIVDAQQLVAALEPGALVGLSYSEPALGAELTLELARAGRAKAVEIIWKSNGFLTHEAAQALAPALGAVNLDVKTLDPTRHRAMTGGDLGPVLDTLRRFFEAGVWVEVSTPVIPGWNGDEATLGAIAEAIAAVSPDIPWHLARFTPVFQWQKALLTAPHTLARAGALGRAAGLRYVYVERALGSDGRTTFCPTCRKVLVVRGVWQVRENRLAKGCCPGCGAGIAGRW